MKFRILSAISVGGIVLGIAVAAYFLNPEFLQRNFARLVLAQGEAAFEPPSMSTRSANDQVTDHHQGDRDRMSEPAHKHDHNSKDDPDHKSDPHHKNDPDHQSDPDHNRDHDHKNDHDHKGAPNKGNGLDHAPDHDRDNDSAPSSTPRAAIDADHDPATGKTESSQRHDHNAEGRDDPSPDTVVPISSEKAERAGITVFTVGSGIIARRLTAPGVVISDPDRITRVPVKVVGTVVEMRKRLGDEVQEGEVVAVLDSREVADAKSEYLTATVNADLQKTNFEREKKLWEKRITAEADFLRAGATYDEAKLRSELSRQKLVSLNLHPKRVEEESKADLGAGASNLRRYEIQSSSAGRVIGRTVEVGASVGQDSDPKELYTIADLSSVWIELAVPISSIDGIKEGQSVLINLSGNSEKQGEGKIVFISPLLNPETRSARVIAEIDNPDTTWRPGTFITASIAMAKEPVTVGIPRTSIQLIEGKQVVFVKAEEGFEKREVVIGKSDRDNFEIVEGLRPGDIVAATNTFLLKAELGKSEAEHSH